MKWPIVFCFAGALAIEGSVLGGTRQVEAVDLDSTKICLERLVGLKVETKSGERLGDVHDVIVDRDSGTARFVLVEGAGELAGKRVAAPLEAILFKALPLSNDASQSEFSEWFARCRFVIERDGPKAPSLIELKPDQPAGRQLSERLQEASGEPARLVGIKRLSKLRVGFGTEQYLKVKDVVVDVANLREVWLVVEVSSAERIRLPLAGADLKAESAE